MDQKPDFKRLRLLQVAALVAAATVFFFSLWAMGQFRRPELAPFIMSFAFGGIMFGIAGYMVAQYLVSRREQQTMLTS